jgi:cobalt/nickel transport system permease protein
MHIPDGFLDSKVALGTAAIAVIGVGVALRQLERTLPPRKVPLLGLGAAFVFAAQMLNFPIGGGTSGHLIGSVLITVLLGPAAAAVVLTAVLLMQCFLFADGGITALGANIVNMAIVAPVVGSAVLSACRRWIRGQHGLVVGAAFAAWCSVIVASATCAGQLALSGTVAANVGFSAMLSVHAVIGIGEGLITALVVVALLRARPDLLANDREQPEVGRGVPWLAAIASIVVMVCLAPFASEAPDGLEWVAGVLGFEHAAVAPASAPLENYQASFLGSPWSAVCVAGAIGTVVVFAMAWLLGRLLVPRQRAG